MLKNPITEGSVVHVLTDTTPEKKAENCRLVAAALTFGFNFLGDYPVTATVMLNEDETTLNKTSWVLDGGIKAEVKPGFASEKLNFAEFEKRFNDLDWCEKNKNHPIAYLRFFSDNHKDLIKKVKNLKPMRVVQKGKRRALIPAGTSEEKTLEILAKL